MHHQYGQHGLLAWQLVWVEMINKPVHQPNDLLPPVTGHGNMPLIMMQNIQGPQQRHMLWEMLLPSCPA